MEKKKQEEYDFFKEEIKKSPVIKKHRGTNASGWILSAVIVCVVAVLAFLVVRPAWNEHIVNKKRITESKAAYLGIEVCTVTEDMKKKYGLPEGVYVRSVNLDSPALYAGLHAGDVIQTINEHNLYNQEQYETFLSSSRKGQELEIRVQRLGSDGNYQKVDCKATLTILE